MRLNKERAPNRLVVEKLTLRLRTADTVSDDVGCNWGAVLRELVEREAQRATQPENAVARSATA